MNKVAHSVCKRTSARVSSKRNGLGFFTSLLLILLPKCPLCLTAYTGAIAMCSGKTMMGELGYYGQVVFIILSGVILISLAINWRGKRTIISMPLVLVSLILIGLSETQIIANAGYYIGSLGLFIGIWTNGSLFYFIRKAKEHLPIIKSKLPTA